MKLTEEQLVEIRNTHILIEHYRNMVVLLENTERGMVERASGVDLSQGNYRLDLEKGTLDAVTEQ